MSYCIEDIIVDDNTLWNSITVVNNYNQPVKWKSLFSCYVPNIEETDKIELMGQFVATNNTRPNMFLASKIFAFPSTVSLPVGYQDYSWLVPNASAEIEAAVVGGPWDGTSKNVSSSRHHETETTLSMFTGLTGDYYFNLCAWGADGTLTGLNTSYFDVESGNGNLLAKHYKLIA